MTELPLVGDEFAGYRLRSVLGRGGMSVVYQAENPRLGSVIALKVLAPDLATDNVFRTRFLEESRIAASLNHPNVIPIYDMGSSGGLLYIVMRYVSGTDLRQMIKKRGRLLPSTAVFLLAQAARALDAAHRRGLVHRDVKPGNLLIERGTDEDDPEHLYLADFGITKHAMDRSGLTSTGQFLGTVDYVAPEQIRGMSVVGLADQYSLGCVLYECLTGRVPFEKDLDAAIIWAHVEESPAMPSALRPDLPPVIDHVFARVLSKQPGDRYDSCREFMEAARVALGDLALEPRTLGSLSSLRSGAPASKESDPVTEPLAVRTQSAAIASGRHAAAPSPGTPDGQPPRGPRRRGLPRPRWLAAAAALVLVAAGLGTWALVRDSGPTTHGTAMSAMSATPKPKPKPKPPAPSALMSALMLTNSSGGQAKGDLPPSTCRAQGATMVTCTAPAPGISGASFQTYPSLAALYAAYVAKAQSVGSGPFQPNFQDCEPTQTVGEISWNHQFQHPRNYSVAQSSSGKLMDDQAAGRVYCNFVNGQEYMVWTQNDGHLLAWVWGPLHEQVWNWWFDVHHNIGFTASPMHM